MPAMLKGWVDRVWGPASPSTTIRKDKHLEPALRNIRLFGVVTTYGSPWWIVTLFAGNAGKKVLMRGMKPLCAKDVRSFYWRTTTWIIRRRSRARPSSRR